MNPTRALVAALVVLLSTCLSTPTWAGSSDRFAVTITASTTQLVTGHKLVISGRATPAKKGATVLLEKRFEGEPWKTEETSTLDGHGRYTFTDKPSTMNARSYRVVVPAVGRHARGTSKVVDVTVYQWHDLSALAVRAYDNVFGEDVSIDGTKYPRSYVGYLGSSPATGSIDWNLDHECLRLKATFGMSDEADDEASAQIDVDADGTTLYSGTFQLTQTATKTLDITDVFRLAFDVTSLSAVSSRPAIGTPRVLCSF